MTTQQPEPQRSAPPAAPPPASDRRHGRLRGVLWVVALLGGGAVLILLYFATIGMIDFSEQPVLGVIALALGVFFLVTMWALGRSGDRRIADRERRGF